MPKINDLFTLSYGHSLELNRLEQSATPEAINFVGRAARNNGVTAQVKPIPGLEPAPAGTITVALNGQGGAGVAFLQPFPFYSGFHIMVLTPRKPMTEQEKLWWVLCITANRFRFGFGRQANRTLKDLVLPEPMDRPEWTNSTSVLKFDGASCPQHAGGAAELSTTHWLAFRYDKIFEIKKGYYNKKPPTSSREGGIPFIGATEYNNGVTAYIAHENLRKFSKDGSINPDEPLNRKIFPGECITVSNNGSVGEAFYQPAPFTCTHDVNPLYLKDKRVRLTPELGLFLATVIRADKYRWGFGRKWRPIRMPDSLISLPVTSVGKPDWDYMVGYIKSLPYSSQVE
ncbi:restriction endonuclease subunit S [Acidithiobacillus albertensis]|uniref:restriction endonuclease subunit S n=1 Tax=Acidithiobacillus albertensis TaxID=119978 RepID=UPI00094AA8F8|nr:restriction endonuclease subunit S [Acidithiobacillus albertensis]MDD2749414.1 restriction endonuclease subunit S [Acidithiobacillus sp.]